MLESLGIQREKISIYLNCIRKGWFYDSFANRLGTTSEFFSIYLKQDNLDIEILPINRLSNMYGRNVTLTA